MCKCSERERRDMRDETESLNREAFPLQPFLIGKVKRREER